MDGPKLYRDLASWWPLMSTPDDYAEEAAVYARTMLAAARRPIRTMVELGSGGGNNASHLKHRFTLTLVEPSAGMLDVSRRLNPECEHVVGDMRTVRLGRRFDAVFVHDAVMYMTTPSELRAAIETAFVHCEPGGVALFCPDYVRENFRQSTDHGGHDHPDGRGLRFVEWVWDPDPAESARQDVGDPVDLVRPAIAVFQDHLDVGRDVGVRWAGGLAGDVLAHPADVARIGRGAHRGDHPAPVGLALGEVLALVEIDLADLLSGHRRSHKRPPAGADIRLPSTQI
jgi:hypothetical protein